MKTKSAFLIQLAGAGFVGWLAADANYPVYQAMTWILAWVVVCIVLRMIGDE